MKLLSNVATFFLGGGGLPWFTYSERLHNPVSSQIFYKEKLDILLLFSLAIASELSPKRLY